MLIIRANKNKNDKAVILNDKSSVNNQNNEIILNENSEIDINKN
jgi:hypothetical protein